MTGAALMITNLRGHSDSGGLDVKVISNALKSPTAKIIQDGYYQNDQAEWGYYIAVSDAGHHHMVSVKHTGRPVSTREIAEALIAPSARIESDGRYRNKRLTPG
jgi:hypothetical protein